ncbi:dimethylarginine dimethylaminohydrolase family protein [Microbacterium sp. TNHR37B]|uniref:dimethylarginine dimethylaminohydrolase family protein n=1 Tax=Microbacterium sp. TNHR37B TaxID=1775956 RepID=UPI0007B24333|nr:arginine deiminase family protein [Microbacterium sp. TNHR37B]KZE89859.1 N(G),N(G)-dimethylarginine dimethylaminohydrolase [Microbacterium sp. TNHR37B]
MTTIDSTLEISDGRFHALLGPEPLPAFDDTGELEATWGRRWGAADEVSRLRSVLVRRPSPGLADIRADAYSDDLDALVDPALRWYWTGRETPDLDRVAAEHDGLVDTLRAHGVEVHVADELPRTFTKSIYTRDPLVTIPGGAIIGRLAARVRRGEEQSITAAVAGAGMPILGTITGSGLVEGGTFVKVRRDTAFFGTSVRCNPEGYRQLARLLEPHGITLHRFSLPGYLIHLDMCSSMLDDDLALVNPRLAPYDYMNALRELDVELVEVHPSEEWACNLLVLDRRTVIMPDHLPRTAEMLADNHGVTVITLPYREILKNGGGIHCSTMELQRDWA